MFSFRLANARRSGMAGPLASAGDTSRPVPAVNRSGLPVTWDVCWEMGSCQTLVLSPSAPEKTMRLSAVHADGACVARYLDALESGTSF